MLAELRESGNCNRPGVMEEKRQDDFFFRMIPVANPDTLDKLMQLALVVRDEKRMDNLVDRKSVV